VTSGTFCHDRGREFESRRPRHSFQKSWTNFAATNEGAKGHVFAPFLHPLSSIRTIFTSSAFTGLTTLTGLRWSSFQKRRPAQGPLLAQRVLVARLPGVNIQRGPCNEECRNNSCITLNSVPTLRSRVEYVCRNVCHPNCFCNSCPQRDGTNISAQYCLAPDRLPAPVSSGRENPIVATSEFGAFSPIRECLQHSWMNRNRLLRRFSLARTYHSAHDGARYVNRALSKVDVSPLQSEQLALSESGRGCKQH
jgi:hypothetical protein